MKGEVPYVILQKKIFLLQKNFMNSWYFKWQSWNPLYHETNLYWCCDYKKYKIVWLLLQVPIHTKTFRYGIALYVYSAPY